MAETTQATILIVDDREENRYTTRRILMRAGYKVLEAATGREALAVATTHNPDLVILDVHLPDIDGFEVCKRIKTAAPTSVIPVLHLSACFVESEDRVRGLESGADGYLTQPIQADEIVATVRALLRARLAEEELRRTNERLAEHAEALTRANAALAEADRRKDEFLAMLAHELRNPLAPIRNAVHILRIIGAKDVAAMRQKELIERQVRHMAHLLDDLLDVARVTQGKITLHRQRLHLRDVLLHALETARPLIEARRHILEFSPPPHDLCLEGDLDRLAQAVGNLLTNAAKYTEEGGCIWLKAWRQEGAAIVSVRDSGIGISPEMLPQVFDLFAQADRSLDRSQGGLGIGLTMVKNLTEMHGGTVEVCSEGVGKGSIFTMRLPALSDDAAGGEELLATASGLPKPERQLRILVVDDVADSAASLAELLELWGHSVRKTEDGPTALSIAQEFHPEVVLLDIGMPGMDGYEVARRLRRRHGLKPRLIAMTGYGQTHDRDIAVEAGFDHHLVKPVDLDALSKLLRDDPRHDRKALES